MCKWTGARDSLKTKEANERCSLAGLNRQIDGEYAQHAQEFLPAKGRWREDGRIRRVGGKSERACSVACSVAG